MSLSVETKEKSMAALTIETSAEEFDQAINKAYQKQKNQISVPGFRKGKVPRQMVEKMYGAEVFYEDAANFIIPDAYEAAAEESGLDIVSQPKIDVVQIEKGKSFIFTAEVAVKPEVKLGEYKGIEVAKTEIEVTEEEIAEELKKEQEKNARSVQVEDRAVADKDEVMLDFEGFVDGVAFEGGKGENYPLTIGSGSFIPGFEEQLIGAEIGADIEVNVTFPEEYQSQELAGKDAVFKCRVNEIKAKELPELDDEFASEISEFDTLDEYKADVKDRLQKTKEEEAKRAKEDAVIDAIIENAEMEIPEPMIETQTRQMVEDFAQRVQQQGISMEQYLQITGMDSQQMMEQMKPQALKRIQSRLVLEAIVAAEGIEATEEEFEEEMNKMAEMYQMEADKLRELVGEAEKEQITTDIAVQNAVTFVTDAAVEQ